MAMFPDRGKYKNSDGRNLVANYYSWLDEHIKQDLDNKRLNYSVLCQNIVRDINVSTIIRNSNVFLARNVYIYGIKKYDRRGACGTNHYCDLKHIKETDSLDFIDREFNKIVGVEINDKAISINKYKWEFDKRTLMIFGNENFGICDELLSKCHDVVYIPLYGSIPSINVGTAAGIVMNSYCSQYFDK